MQVIILLGRSGSGKGTQGKLLQAKFGLEYIGSGDLLRARAAQTDYSGITINTVLARGGFSPTALIFKLWMDKMEDFKARTDFNGFLFDGSPRKIMEAYLIDEAMEWYGWRDAMKIFLLDVPRSVAFGRLAKRRLCKTCRDVTSLDFFSGGDVKLVCRLCGDDLVKRFDDTTEGIASRLDLFEKEVMPAIEYYEKDNRLISIDGTKDIQGVYGDICKKLS